MRWLPLSLACLLASTALALSTAPSSRAATPCWKAVIADWSKNDAVDGHYSTLCLRQAMVNAPTDLKIYSSLEDDLQAALRVRSVRRLAGTHQPAAGLAAPTGSSALSPLVLVLAGLGALVAVSAGAAAVRRRRAAR
jgi:hypothetical protein